MTPRLHSSAWRVAVAAAAATAVLGLAGCGSGSSGSSPSTAAGATPEIQDGLQVFHVTGLTTDKFQPNTLIAHAGRVRIVLSVPKNSAPHDLVFTKDPAKKIPLVMAGSTSSMTFTVQSGHTYQFNCDIHPGMTGKLVVR